MVKTLSLAAQLPPEKMDQSFRSIQRRCEISLPVLGQESERERERDRERVRERERERERDRERVRERERERQEKGTDPHSRAKYCT